MVAVDVGHRLTTFLTLVKQIGKEYSHSRDSGRESVGAQYSLQASNKIRFVSHNSLYPWLG